MSVRGRECAREKDKRVSINEYMYMCMCDNVAVSVSLL